MFDMETWTIKIKKLNTQKDDLKQIRKVRLASIYIYIIPTGSPD